MSQSQKVHAKQNRAAATTNKDNANHAKQQPKQKTQCKTNETMHNQKTAAKTKTDNTKHKAQQATAKMADGAPKCHAKRKHERNNGAGTWLCSDTLPTTGEVSPVAAMRTKCELKQRKMQSQITPLTQSLTHSLTHSLAHPSIHTPIHSLTRTFIH